MKISVITAVWNAEKSIARCVESVKGNDVEHAMLDVVFHYKSIRCSRNLFLFLVFSSNFKGVGAVNQKIGFCCGLHLVIYL